MYLTTGHRIMIIEMNEMDNNNHSAFIKCNSLGPYCAGGVDFLRFKYSLSTI